MTRFQKIILFLLSASACALTGMVAYYGYSALRIYSAKPLGPALAQPEVTLIRLEPTWTPSPAPGGLASSTNTPASRASSASATPLQAALCGGPNLMNLLAIGTDARSDNYNYGLADVIRIIRVDFKIPRVTVLEFPRDLWVEIPEISDNIDQDHEKLNQAYLYGNPGFAYYDHPSAGPGLLSQTLALNFGVKVNNYLAVNMRTFEKMVDAIGGIDITLDKPVKGSDDPLFQIGEHHLDGAHALALARNRVDGVFSRADYQNQVVCALKAKLSRPETVTQIPELIAAFQDNIQTDLSPGQIGQLACVGAQIRSENVVFTTFPEELFEPASIFDSIFDKKVFIWKVDFNILQDYVARFQAGTWPARSTSGSEKEAAYTCP